MNRAHDRRLIAPLLLPLFPEMEGQSSDSWRAFLDDMCGTETDPHEDNGSAFDRWRKALAAMGYEGVWKHTPASEAALAAAGREMADRARAAHAEQIERASKLTAEFEATKQSIADARAAALRAIAKGDPT